MLSLVLGSALFVGIHLFVSGTTLRDRITDRIGEGPYLGLFSLASAGALTWMCIAYSNAPQNPLWADPPFMRSVSQWVAMPLAFFFAVVGITTPSPTATGGEKLLDSEDPVTGILRITRHPFLWGVVIWSATHLLANGDAASLVFFAAFLVLAIGGPRAIDAKRARKLGARWEGFAQATSNLPFAAIASGRNRLVLSEFAVWRVAAAAAAFAAIYVYHDTLFH